MNLAAFHAERHPDWGELEELLRRAGDRPERLGPDGVRRLAALYRSASADLAFARRRFPGDPLVGHLERLVVAASQRVYGAGRRRPALLGFLARDAFRLVAERPVPLLVALILLLAPTGLSATWATTDPEAARGVVPGAFRSSSAPRSPDAQLSPDQSAAMSSEIFTNNLRVTFLAFAGGATLGVLTVAVLVQNGILLGAVGGLAAGSGRLDLFVTLVAPHGLLELTCIVVSGAAGLRLGWALVEPGRRRRRDAFAAEARRTVLIVLGTAPWLVLAGLVEGFVTPSGLTLPAAVAIALAVAAPYWALLAFRGFG